MKFVPVWSYDNYVPAHLDMGRLKDAGIESWLKDEHSVTINPALSNAVGGIKLMVAAGKAREAWEVLIREKAAYIGSLSCPHCGSNNLAAREVPRRAASRIESILVFLLGKNSLGFELKYQCQQCNSLFDEPVYNRPETEHSGLSL